MRYQCQHCISIDPKTFGENQILLAISKVLLIPCMSKFPLLDVIVHNTVRSLYFVTVVFALFLCEILMTNHKVKTAHCIMNTNIQQWKLRHTGNQKNFADNNSIFLGSESS